VLLRRFIRLTLLMITMFAMSVGLATSASAATAHKSSTVDIDGGNTALTVAAGTLKVLTDNGVKVTPIKGASASGRTFTFPITDGDVDATTLAGTIKHSGGLQIAAGGKKLRVQDFVIDTRKSVLTVRISGTHTRLALLDLNLKNAHISKGKTQIVVSDVHASLTGTAAAALNKKFGVSLFKKGLAIGTAKVTARP
jgi:hypothetical protein